MFIPEWRKDATLDIWIRSTYAYPGPIIRMGGTKPGIPVLVPRRKSVIDATGAGIRYRIISLSYMSAPAEHPFGIHEKYNSGEVVVLMDVPFNGTIEEALLWTGMPQEIEVS